MPDPKLVKTIGEWRLTRWEYDGAPLQAERGPRVSFDGKPVDLSFADDGDLEIEVGGRVLGFIPPRCSHRADRGPAGEAGEMSDFELHPTPRYFLDLADDLCRDLTAALATGETGPDVDELIEVAAKARAFATEEGVVRS